MPCRGAGSCHWGQEGAPDFHGQVEGSRGLDLGTLLAGSGKEAIANWIERTLGLKGVQLEAGHLWSREWPGKVGGQGAGRPGSGSASPCWHCRCRSESGPPPRIWCAGRHGSASACPPCGPGHLQPTGQVGGQGLAWIAPGPARPYLPLAHRSAAGPAGPPGTGTHWACSQQCGPSHLEVPGSGAAERPPRPGERGEPLRGWANHLSNTMQHPHGVVLIFSFQMRSRVSTCYLSQHA